MSYDPYATKMASVSAVPINSQPNPSHYAPIVGTVAMPSAAGLYVSPAAQAHHVQQQQPVQGSHTVRPPEGRWRDSICDWGNNLFPSCYCACCFFYGMYLVAQMAQKTGLSNFSTVLWITVIVWFIALILTGITGAAVFIFVVPLLFSFVFALVLRMHVARTQNITECGAFGEFCCGFWCWYCSIAQMARHLYGYQKVLDGDSEVDRPDNYAPYNNQV